MAKLLLVEPKTGENIVFPSVLSRQLETSITLTNTSSTLTLAFKMKVNSPKTYLVRPSGGVLGPNESTVVIIILQSLTEKVPSGHHRFLIHSVPVPEGTTSLSREEWPRLSKEKQLEEQLLNVVFSDDNAAVRDSDLPKQASGGTPDGAEGGDINAKFDELKGYALSLEKELLNLDAKKSGTSARAGRSAGGGYSIFHMVLAVIISLAIMKLPFY